MVPPPTVKLGLVVPAGQKLLVLKKEEDERKEGTLRGGQGQNVILVKMPFFCWGPFRRVGGRGGSTCPYTFYEGQR